MLPLLLPLFAPIIEKLTGLIPDPEARAKAQAEATKQLLDAAMQADQAQMDTNKAEAASGSIFVAGWRPFIGWVCGSALAYQYLVSPLGGALANGLGHPMVFPGLDDHLWELLTAMLGLGGLRTVEKIKNVANGK